MIVGEGVEKEIDLTAISCRKYKEGRIVKPISNGRSERFGKCSFEFVAALTENIEKKWKKRCPCASYFIKNSLGKKLIIYCDSMGSHHGVDETEGYDYKHLMINHSENFVVHRKSSPCGKFEKNGA